MSNLEGNSNGINPTSYKADHSGTLPRRVILRLRVNEFEGNGHSWDDHVDAIQAYFKWVGLPLSELEGENGTKKYFAHVEPFQALELKQTTFHVILDIQDQPLDEVDLDSIPHEVYRVRRNPNGNLEVQSYRNPLEAKNVISKVRGFTDIIYPWAGKR